MSFMRATKQRNEAELAESARLEALDRYDILDSPPEPGFDLIARLIKNIFDLPVAIVSVIDGHRQWYKAVEGMPNSEAPLKDTFCRYTLLDRKSLIVPDATTDRRFASSPYVLGNPHIRFYASTPLTTPDGHVVGTLCGIDMKPRAFTPREEQILADLARLAMDLMEARRKAATSVDPAPVQAVLESASSDVRRRVLKSGRILFNNRNSTIDCTVRSLSSKRAGMDVSSSMGIPERFDLAIPADGFESPCRVVARTERHIEVDFS